MNSPNGIEINGRTSLPLPLRKERGQVLPLALLTIITMMCFTGFVVDSGRVFVGYQQLVASTDSAALAAGQNMAQGGSTTTTVNTSAVTYGSETGDKNGGDLNSVTTTTMPLCLTTLENQGIGCYGAGGSYNAVRVVQTTVVPTTFANFFGTSSVTLTSTATAAMAGAPPVPYNVAIILDNSLSQATTDDNCGSGVTEEICERSGVQIFLQHLVPCALTVSGACSITSGQSANSVDRVALFTFPAVTVGTVGIYTGCTSPITAAAARTNGYQSSSSYGYYSMEPEPAWAGIPTATPYSFPTVGATSYAPPSTPVTTSTYQVTSFLSDYRTNDNSTTLNTGSDLVQALGGESGCGGMIPPNYDGDIGTYYAGVIYAAQASLVAEQAANPGSSNVMILLSDGNATAPQSFSSNGATVYAMPSSAHGGTATSNGLYPSWNNECAQAVTAAQYATNQGTKVYSIAYGSESSGCTSDASGITPCQTMQQIASNSGYFFSDYEQSGSGVNRACVGTNASNTSLAAIFGDVYYSLGKARLIPNGTT